MQLGRLDFFLNFYLVFQLLAATSSASHSTLSTSNYPEHFF